MTLTDLKNRKAQQGFTIVELLIVIVVIAILAALVLTAYNGVQARARDSSRLADVRAITTAVEAIASENSGTYPADKAAIVAGTVVKLDSTLQAKITDTAAADPSGTNKDVYEYDQCTGGAGAKVLWWKEETSALQVKNIGSASGTTTTC